MKTISTAFRGDLARGWFLRALTTRNMRLDTDLLHERWFVTSEEVTGEGRRHTLREVLDNGHVATIGSFRSYRTLGDALTSLNAHVLAHGFPPLPVDA